MHVGSGVGAASYIIYVNVTGWLTATRPLLTSCAVVAVRFAHNDKSRLACCSHDGTLSVFSLASEPPVLACSLRGHTAAVNGEQGGARRGGVRMMGVSGMSVCHPC